MVGSSRNSTFGRWRSGGGELALHALAERELARRLLEQRLELEQRDELVERLAVLRARHAVDRAVELEGLRRRQVPQELLLLSGHQHDRAQEARVALRRARSRATRASPAVGWSSPDSILSVVVLPAPLGPRKPTRSPASISKLDAVDRLDRAVDAPEERAQGCGEPGRPRMDAVVLGETVDRDHGGRPRRPERALRWDGEGILTGGGQ